MALGFQAIAAYARESLVRSITFLCICLALAPCPSAQPSPATQRVAKFALTAGEATLADVIAVWPDIERALQGPPGAADGTTLAGAARRVATTLERHAPAAADHAWLTAARAAAHTGSAAQVAYVGYHHVSALLRRGIDGCLPARQIVAAYLSVDTSYTPYLLLLRARIEDALGDVGAAWRTLERAEALTGQVTDTALAAALKIEATTTRADFLLTAGQLRGAAELYERVHADAGRDRRYDRLMLALAGEDGATARALLDELGGGNNPRLALVRAEVERVNGAEPATVRTWLERADQPTASADVRRALAVEFAALEAASGQFDAARARLAALAPFYDQHGLIGLAGRRWAAVTTHVALAAGDAAELARATAVIDRAWRAARDRWEASPPTRRGQAFLQFYQRRDLVSLRVALHARLHGAPAAAHALLEAEALDSQVRAMPAIAVDFAAALRHATPPRGGLLAYVSGHFITVVMAFDANGGSVHELPGDARLRPTVERLGQILERATIGDVETNRRIAELLAELTTWALPPSLLARIAPWQDIAIIGRETIARLPFEILPYEGERLGRVKAIGYLPSITLAEHLTARGAVVGTPRSGNTLFVADTPVAPGLAPLEAQRWLPQVAAALPEPTAVLDGAAATLANLIDPRRAASASCALIAHGVATENGPALALADTVADSEALAGAHLPPLVMLFACGSGRSTLHRGDASGDHLGRAALGAGAQVVGIADHDLDLRSGIALLLALHRELGRAPHSAEALRRARAALAADDWRGLCWRFEGLPFGSLVAPSQGASFLWLGVGIATVSTYWLTRRRRRRTHGPG
jgi:hypothetical protein